MLMEHFIRHEMIRYFLVGPGPGSERTSEATPLRYICNQFTMTPGSEGVQVQAYVYGL